MQTNHCQRSLQHYYLKIFLVSTCLTLGSTARSADLPELLPQETALHYIPKTVAVSLEKNQIPKEAISISVMEVDAQNPHQVTAKPSVAWRASQAMNPASTMKILTTLSGLDLLGPQYRWKTNLYTDGFIRQGTLKGNLYLQGTGDPKWVPEELARMMKALQDLGIQKIDGNLIFDRSAYAQNVMEQNTIDGELSRAYNVSPDPLLYAFRTLSFQLGKSPTADFIDIQYTPALSKFSVVNQLRLTKKACENWKQDINFQMSPETTEGNQDQALTATFSGTFPASCNAAIYNVVAIDANTFLTEGFSAAWELAGGTWAQPPTGISGSVPITARPLLQFEGSRLLDDVQDINKFSNNVMARQLFLTLALEKMGKPATTQNSVLIIHSWLKKVGLDFPELVLENGSGLSRHEVISAEHMNALLLTARNLSVAEPFYTSLPIAGIDGTMKNRLLTQLRKFLHLRKKPEARIKTGSLADVRAISGYVISKSGKMYLVTSFINHPNASKGMEAQDQLLTWLFEDGPEPKQAR